jgi:drug/metabolite transporter (DMT)-like permease
MPRVRIRKRNGGWKILGGCWKTLPTGIFRSQDTSHGEECTAPFKNSRIVDWAIFFSAIIFSLILLVAGGAATQSISSLNPRILLSAVGIAVFYILGEWWRRRPVEKQTITSSRRLVLGVLIAGLVVFILGLGFLFEPFVPPNYVLTMVSYAVLSSIIGLVAGFILVKALQKKDEITV